MRPTIRLALVCFAIANGHCLAADGGSIDYNRDIRPLLSENCYACHGPDTAARKADLRLDRRDDAMRDRSGHAAIVPGQADDSTLIARVEDSDSKQVMPPPASGKVLKPEQVELLRRWVEGGARWDAHWSYIAPKRPPEPEVKADDWSKNPIDRFVLARLEAVGVNPSPEADRPTLLRRVALDLNGLPPSPAEVEAFQADPAPDAYEKAVDRLLAAPSYGERMAQHWLDLARYADTNGYHIDNHRDIWKYREWVIDACNANQPFDAFAVEQLAGDLLPGATLDQRVATGFSRAGMVNFEGGADPDEYLTKYIVDRVNTTATVFLAATIGCAECHDHKYDPFTQREYYQLYAYFHNVPEAGLDGLADTPAPRMKVPTPEQAATLATLRAKLGTLQVQHDGPIPAADAGQVAWEAEQAKIRANPGLGWVTVDPAGVLSRNGASLSRQADLSILASGANPARDVYEVVAATKATAITGLRLEVLPHESLPGKGTSRSDAANFVLTEVGLEASPEADPAAARQVQFARAEADFAQPEGDFAARNAIDGDPKSGWAAGGKGRSIERRAVFVANAPFGVEGGTILRFRLRFESPHDRHVIGRFRLAITSADSPSIHTEPPAPIREALAVEPAARTDPQKAALRAYYRTTFSAEARAIASARDAAQAEATSFEKSIPQTMVMEEMATPRATHMLVRGDFRTKGERVAPGVPASLPPLPDGQPNNRLALARWLVDPGHPLVARVFVNRAWQQHFGTGIVASSDDFGSQGEWPSHPELLDWLAREFVDGGWDIKALHRSIVTSAAYRQSSRVRPGDLERDPANRLLARGPRFRLDAEAIRDNALAVSGLLAPKHGGPSVYPFQPAGLWEELAIGRQFTSQAYSPSKGDDLHRRAIYTYWKRSVPYPSMSTFDAPNRELCTVKRPRTNTPLQALVLLNDPVYLEAARGLGLRAIREGGSSFEERSAFAFRACLAREPTEAESAILARVYDRQLARFRSDPAAAEAFLKVGETPRPTDVDPAELAAWTALGNVLLNLDETITPG